MDFKYLKNSNKSPKEIQQLYINNFRRRFTAYLRPGIGLACDVYPTKSGEAVIAFTIGEGIQNEDTFHSKSNNLGSALKNVKQSAFSGSIENIKFSGTNVILENNKIIFIKDANRQEWTDSAVKHDLKKIFSHMEPNQ